MATKVEAPSELAVRGRRFVLSGVGAKLHDSWVMRHWQTVLVLVLILILAFFVRTYFAYDLTVDN
ncbi:MAG: hypothetical protein LUO79_06660, partial [Methanomassiliicoccales archaeon]|nr:hypothetical protein [Methanomassiliicoccales archaeon]